MADYWFNTATGEVEEGRVSDWSVVMGPYPTREAAAAALRTARARSTAWDAEDRAWAGADGDGGGQDDGPASSDDRTDASGE